ncbi:specific transcriptional repressor [Coprinopsis cinerea AmutBmut pab1-1]|nr:specific transcriptional repressor [Coprinopsis cinerea AmutBmut pab1-1]
MPALRSGHPAMLPRNRRRSSHLALFTPAKPGVYGVGIQQPAPQPSQQTSPSSLTGLPPRPISFAPNVTPGTFVESEDSSPTTPEPLSPNSQPKLFPPSETPAPPPVRKRCPPGKRRSQGYIPRPPNAFMLFRADFVRQKHVPGSIETNHGSLSKIIGNCWRSLPLEEKKVWEQKAKQEKAAHKIQYPNYRFRPVHNKKKKQAEAAARAQSSDPEKRKQDVSPEEEIRCEEVTQLLLEGKKGEDLARAVRQLEESRKQRIREMQKLKGQSQTPGPFPSNLTMPQRNVAFPGGIMTAPQPTYPAGSLLSGNSNGSFFPGDNAAAGSYLHLRRSSSVPLPGAYNGGFDFNNFNFGGGPMDFYMPPPSYPESQQQHQQDQPMGDSSAGIALPSVPFLPPPSSSGIAGIANSSLDSQGPVDDSNINLNVASISKHQQRMLLGHRRSSSAGPAFGGMQRNWTAPFDNNNFGYGYFNGIPGSTMEGDYQSGNIVLQRDDSPLPEADLSLFDPNFFNATHNTSAPVPAPEDPNAPRSNAGTTNTTPNGAFNVTELMHGLPPTLGPLDTTGIQSGVSPHDMVSPADSYWSNDNNANMFQAQSQQQGLGLEIGPTDVPPDSTVPNATTSGPTFDQMYLAEQDQQRAMDMNYGNTGAYPDANSYNYGPLDMGVHGGVQYVEC